MEEKVETYREVEGDLIQLAKEGNFDVIAHGCNCFLTMSAGIAVAIANNFPDAYFADQKTVSGDESKLGTFSTGYHYLKDEDRYIEVLNCYTQFGFMRNSEKPPVDYDAIRDVLTKINVKHKWKSIGLPLIGCGLAGGDWNKVKGIIQETLTDMDVTIVHYNG